jgi:ferredoxin
MPKVTFEREQVVIDVPEDTTLLAACERAGVDPVRGIWTGLRCRRVPGWCNRCKVWVKPAAPGAINEPTAKERSRLRVNGRVAGAMRLACQVELKGDVVVHTRVGGPAARAGQPIDDPLAWRNRVQPPEAST